VPEMRRSMVDGAVKVSVFQPGRVHSNSTNITFVPVKPARCSGQEVYERVALVGEVQTASRTALSAAGAG
jgi:hypothetical protein